MSFKTKLKEWFRKMHHKGWVRGVVYAVWIIGFPVVGVYSYFIEPKLVSHSCVKINLKHKKKPTARPLKIVQISDLHFGPTNHNPAFFKKCVQKINALNADLIALTGDFMQWNSSYAVELGEILGGLKSRLGSFAILGNHDYGVCHAGVPSTDPVNHLEVIEAFQDNGIRVLHNESITLDHHDHRVDIVGLGDYWTEHFKPLRAFNKKDPKRDYPVILLSHNPDSLFALEEYDFDLMLAGHVHGGQISFPFIGPLVVPVKNRHLRRGLHLIGQKLLYTNRGLGFIFRARLLSMPEIAILEIG